MQLVLMKTILFDVRELLGEDSFEHLSTGTMECGLRAYRLNVWASPILVWVSFAWSICGSQLAGRFSALPRFIHLSGSHSSRARPYRLLCVSG